MTRYLIIVVLIAIAGYGLIEAWPLICGPKLTIESPREGAPFPGGTVAIRGTALRVTELSLNGALLPHDEHGSFGTTLTFPRGGSILTFVATDQFGRRITITRSIFVPD